MLNKYKQRCINSSGKLRSLLRYGLIFLVVGESFITFESCSDYFIFRNITLTLSNIDNIQIFESAS